MRWDAAPRWVEGGPFWVWGGKEEQTRIGLPHPLGFPPTTHMLHQGHTCPKPGRHDRAANSNTGRASALQRGWECLITEFREGLRKRK